MLEVNWGSRYNNDVAWPLVVLFGLGAIGYASVGYSKKNTTAVGDHADEQIARLCGKVVSTQVIPPPLSTPTHPTLPNDPNQRTATRAPPSWHSSPSPSVLEPACQSTRWRSPPRQAQANKLNTQSRRS